VILEGTSSEELHIVQPKVACHIIFREKRHELRFKDADIKNAKIVQYLLESVVPYLWLVSGNLRRMGAPPTTPRVVTPAYYYNYVEFVSSAK